MYNPLAGKSGNEAGVWEYHTQLAGIHNVDTLAGRRIHRLQNLYLNTGYNDHSPITHIAEDWDSHLWCEGAALAQLMMA